MNTIYKRNHILVFFLFLFSTKSFTNLFNLQSYRGPVLLHNFLPSLSYFALNFVCKFFSQVSSLIINIMAQTVVVYWLQLLGIAIFSTLAALAHLLHVKQGLPLIMLVPYYFIRVNWSCLLGLLDAWRGDVQTIWQTSRAGKGEVDGTSIGLWLGFGFLCIILIAAFLSMSALITR